MQKLFDASFDSLYQYQCPDWFRDAKFGIWSHWGPQSVPMLGDWYAKFMYMQDHEIYRCHLRKYGHPSKFGYKDICALWQAEKFDPEALMERYYRAGARYFVGQAVHADHFFNYPSQLSPFNAMEMGPHKDICGLWQQAAAKFGLPFGLSEHLACSFSWFNSNKAHDTYGPYAGVPYDGADKRYESLYYDNHEHLLPDGSPDPNAPWYTGNEAFHDHWLAVSKEIIDRYQPDLLFCDGVLPFGEGSIEDGEYRYGLEAAAHLYNTSIRKYGKNRAVYTQKDRRPEIYKVGVLNSGDSPLSDMQADPWQMLDCIGHWFYDIRQSFKKPGQIIEMLVDIVSKNGSMLLNMLQRPDGTIDEEQEYILDELGHWFAANGEGIHGTRPWRMASDDAADYRFTQKGQTLYTFLMRAPENGAVSIKSLNGNERVSAVRLLGHGEVPFAQTDGTVAVNLPDRLPTPYASCLALDLA